MLLQETPKPDLVLRNYQRRAVEVCLSQHKHARSRVLVQFPPGTGKTEVAKEVALAWLRERPFGRVIIVVPNQPILAQFVRRLARCTRIPIAIEKARQRAPRNARLVVASQNSLWDRLSLYPRTTLVIYDEAHHGNLDAPENLKIVDSFDHVAGLSASAWSRGCVSLFGSPTVGLRLSDALTMRVVAPYELHDWETPQGPLGLVFCGSNAECELRSKDHPGSTWIGINSGWVDARIAGWRAGQYQVLYANRMLLEGFDEPRTTNVWITKQTQSDIQFVQMVGRVLRPRAEKVARIYCASRTIRQGVERALARCDDLPNSVAT